MSGRVASEGTAFVVARNPQEDSRLPYLLRVPLEGGLAMFYNDHDPPHFHARYAEHRARIAIRDADVLDGNLPPRAIRLVREWADLHRTELEENWRLAERLHPLNQIEPLP